MAGVRMNKRRRGGKAQAKAAEGAAAEVAAETKSEEVTTPDTATNEEAPETPAEAITESMEGVGADVLESAVKSKGEKASDIAGTPKKGKRRRMKGKKGKNFSKSSDSSAAKEEKIIDLAGLIFMCNTETKKDCFKYRVFGLPEAKKNIVDQVKKGTKLFLFDIDKKVLHGVYKASSEGGENLIEEAFKNSERKFPAQVRFRIQKDCMPLEESVFKLAIKENYYRQGRFKVELNAEQVGRLMKLFRPLDSRGLPEPKPAKEMKRDLTPRGKAPRGPPHTQRSRGPPPRYSAPAPPRERAYKDYAPVYARERHYPELLPPSYVPVPDVSHAEAELLRQRQLRQLQEAQAVEALERRAYLLDPVVEASIARKRYLDDVYAAEQQALAVKRPLVQDSLYRDLEYQREAPYRSYGDGLHAHAGALQYDPRASHLGWP